VSGVPDAPLSGRQSRPSPIHPLPNYAPPPAGPSVHSSPETTPEPQRPAIGCFENIHTGQSER